jgi:Uma2 family endonuclease
MVMPTLDRDWTVADRDALPDDGNRYEVIDGELFVTPSPALRHQAAIGELHVILHRYLKKTSAGVVYMAPGDVVFSPRRGLQPDIFVTPFVDGKRPVKFQDAGRLLLAVEVLSPGSARADRVIKRRVFREEHVPEYWVVDMDARAIERTTPSESRPEVLVERLDWFPDGASKPLGINLPKYFASVLDE